MNPPAIKSPRLVALLIILGASLLALWIVVSIDDDGSDKPIEEVDYSLDAEYVKPKPASRTTPVLYNEGSIFIADKALSFYIPTDWQTYRSIAGGIQFSYPADVQVTEHIYAIGSSGNESRPALFIVGKRLGVPLFEIRVEESKGRDIGGITTLEECTFITLKEGYLCRSSVQYFSGLNAYRSLTYRGVIYVNSSTREKLETAYTVRNAKYLLMAPQATEETLRDVDRIFSSITHPNMMSFENSFIEPLPMRIISVEGVGSAQIQGYIEGSRLVEKDQYSDFSSLVAYRFKPISSSSYEATDIYFYTYPYETVGNIDTNKDTRYGFDATRRKCISYDRESDPVRIGAHDVCVHQSGDAGLSVERYYILDVEHNRIIRVEQAGETYDLQLVFADLEKVIESLVLE